MTLPDATLRDMIQLFFIVLDGSDFFWETRCPPQEIASLIKLNKNPLLWHIPASSMCCDDRSSGSLKTHRLNFDETHGKSPLRLSH